MYCVYEKHLRKRLMTPEDQRRDRREKAILFAVVISLFVLALLYGGGNGQHLKTVEQTTTSP
jgi:hypothetical protein